ncbi:MAG TPA: hypothetical protein VG650_12940 [Mycobacteriales bacterium]|nr:hypothetical protein [Mycobacteriales bacterium]
MEPGPGPRSGARDNGLRCGGYVAVGDLDPRVADAMLETLRAEGIAAYAAPTPASQGGYLELRLPARMTDRLYVDATKSERAEELVGVERAEAEPAVQQRSGDAEIDVDAAWQQLLASLQAPSSTATWPSRENVSETTRPAHLDDLPLDRDLGPLHGGEPVDFEDEHFVPPPAPPLPRLRTVTIGALAAIAAGLLIIVTNFEGGDLVWLAILAIIGGGAALIWNVKSGPPTDSGWDDGAVV